MEQSVYLTKNLIQLYHRGLVAAFDSIFESGSFEARLGKALLLGGADLLNFSSPLPSNPSWTHEEWHRAVLAARDIPSQDDVYKNSTSDIIYVSHVRDSDLSLLKKEHPAEFVRLMSAGMEAQSRLNYLLISDNFFQTGPQSNDLVVLWFNQLNNTFYLNSCATGEADGSSVRENIITGKNQKARDFTGFDCNAWVYDLFRPGEPYEARGPNPQGNGIDRYIKFSDGNSYGGAILNQLQYGNQRRYSDLNESERDYLRLHTRLSVLNFISPPLFAVSSIPAFDGEASWNFSFLHSLTPFGYDVGFHGFFKLDDVNLAITLHSYSNAHMRMPGLELYLLRYPASLFGQDFRFDFGFALWQQPYEQKFWTDRKEAGGSLRTRAGILLFNNIEYYIDISCKSRGWQEGAVYLTRTAELRTGLALLF